MATPNVQTVAFACPGGESSAPAAARPLDLAHLTRQTLGDRSIEAEVLGLFVLQASTVRDALSEASEGQRVQLAHGLRGSAAGIGAFAVAEAAKAIERKPADATLVRQLAERIDEARDFIASISR